MKSTAPTTVICNNYNARNNYKNRSVLRVHHCRRLRWQWFDSLLVIVILALECHLKDSGCVEKRDRDPIYTNIYIVIR